MSEYVQSNSGVLNIVAPILGGDKDVRQLVWSDKGVSVTYFKKDFMSKDN